MAISTIKRRVKNVSYSATQVKVREATSNAPNAATPILLSDIAELTNDAAALTEILVILWKRLNDHGKNWRHVYKSLVLLDYLIKNGNEKIIKESQENIYIIETLKDFQHVDGKFDHGLSVRKNAEKLVTLLNDEEQLKAERQIARDVHGPGTPSDPNTPRSGSAVNDSELEEAKPASPEDEDIQLQIAMALSREENAKEEEQRWNDADQLRTALEESKEDNSEKFEGDSFAEKNVSPDPSIKNQTKDDDKRKSTVLESVLEDIMQLNFYNPAPSEILDSIANTPWNDKFWNCTTKNVADANPSNPFQQTAAPTLSSNVYHEEALTPSKNDPWTSNPFLLTTTPSINNETLFTPIKNDPWNTTNPFQQTNAITPSSNVFSDFTTSTPVKNDSWTTNPFLSTTTATTNSSSKVYPFPSTPVMKNSWTVDASSTSTGTNSTNIVPWLPAPPLPPRSSKENCDPWGNSFN